MACSPQFVERGLGILLAGCLVIGAAACKEGGIEVSDFELVGVHAFSSGQLLAVLATQPEGWLPWSAKRYFDRTDFEDDLKRIQAYYADRGYANAKVTAIDPALNKTKTAVKLTVTVDEGSPTIVDEVRFVGFDSLSENNRKLLNAVPLKGGAPRDYDHVKATRDQATQLFLNSGHPQAYVDASERPGAQPNHVIVIFRADPGPAMTFGEVTIDGLQSISKDVVLRELAFKPGGVYRDSQILRTQHRLSTLDVFQVVSVTARTDEIADNRVPVRVTVAEAPPRQLKLGIGYGSEERARATIDWRHVNAFGGARQAEIEAKGSFLDSGVKLTLTQPYLGVSGLSLALQGTVWRTDQLTYNSETYGGRATLTYRRETNLGAGRTPVRYGFHLAYVNEYLRYGINADALSDQSSREERIALGLDPTTGRGAGTLGALDFDAEQSVVDSQLDPHKGFSTTVHVEHAAPWLLGTYRFTEVTGEGRAYVPILGSVLAARIRLGSVATTNPSLVPFSKLYFLGGSTSERGWGRFESARSTPMDCRSVGARSRRAHSSGASHSRQSCRS